jgi:polynucleotide 5'-kinase involved in rRNA processing
MIKEIQEDNTLLIKGPARITILEGEIEVFGKHIAASKEITSSDSSIIEEKNVLIVPGANNYPLHALEASKLEIYTANEENVKLIEKDSIPKTWNEIKNSILDEIKKRKEQVPLKIMVLGISSGKTTLIKYLANNFIREGLRGGYIDSDLGQQVIYLPTTLNIGDIEDYIVSSEDVKPKQTIFIGATFPKGNFKFIVSHYCKKLIDDYIQSKKDIDFLLIDTDGWIKTEAGIVYKNFFIKTVDPDVLIVFHDENIEELKLIEKNALKIRKDIKMHLLKEKNEYYFDKNKEERRFLRQSQFAKILEGYRKISMPLDDIKFIKADYDKENDKIIEQEIKVGDLIKLPYHYVIIALMTEDSKMIKIGLLFVVNIEKNYILLFSDLGLKEQAKVKKVLLGSLRLSTKGNHQGYLYL